ncbi:MAG: hypothetical protein KAJ12_12025 [Bacteroidetes bacterium]|nr:hypothetical protein [Bacteroidota bacterium]
MNAELHALLSPLLLAATREKNVRLTTYRQLISERGLEAMERPWSGDYR